MGFSYRTYGSMVEIGGLVGSQATLDTTPANYDVGRITTPSSTILGGRILGCYLDFIYARQQNTFAGANWCLADAGSPYVRVIATAGGTERIMKSNITGVFNSAAAGTFEGFRVYGNINHTDIYASTEYEVDLMNVRSNSNNIIVSEIHPIFRLYIS